MSTVSLESLQQEYAHLVMECVALEAKSPSIPLYVRFAAFMGKVGEHLVNIVRVSNRDDRPIDTRFVKYITAAVPFTRMMDDPFLKPASVKVNMVNIPSHMEGIYEMVRQVPTTILPQLRKDVGEWANRPEMLQSVFGVKVPPRIVDIELLQKRLVAFEEPSNTAHKRVTFGKEFLNFNEYYETIAKLNDLYDRITWVDGNRVKGEIVPMLIKQTEDIAKISKLLVNRIEALPVDERPSSASIKAASDYLYQAAVGTEMLANMRMLYGKYHNAFTEHNEFMIRKYKR
jgi:hypothetical protein